MHTDKVPNLNQGLSRVSRETRAIILSERKGLKGPFVFNGVTVAGVFALTPQERRDFIAGEGTCKVVRAGKLVRVL